MKFLIIILIFIFILGSSLLLYNYSQIQSSYKGLPTVPCIDPTKPIVQNFSFFLKITINGIAIPLDSKIGHDYGNCLHDIFVNDPSGKVYVQANGNEIFTLGQFFDEWHKTFSQNKLLVVKVNGKPVNTYRETVFSPNEVMEVIFQ